MGKFIFILLVFLNPFYLSKSQANEIPQFDGLSERIENEVSTYLKAGMFNGVILVGVGDKILFVKGYGDAHRNFNIANGPETKFRIASLTKQFTNAAIAVLLDKGLIQQDSKISDFLPNFPRGDEITIDHLINQSSGITHTNYLEELKGKTKFSLSEMIELLASKELDFDPGTDNSYSNGGYDVLAAIIEKASGKSYEVFLTEDVLEPMGLTDTGQLHTYSVVENLATGYVPGKQPGTLSEPRFYPLDLRVGGGSLYSTVGDVFRLFRSTFQRQFASEEVSDFLFWDKTERYEITGRSPGFVAKVFIDIPRDITIVSLANNYSSLPNWSQRLYQATINEPWARRDLSFAETPRPVHDSDYFNGYFESQYDSGYIYVSPKGEIIFEDRINDWEVAMIPLTNNRYLHPFFDTICTFAGIEKATSMTCVPVLERYTDPSEFKRVQNPE